MDYSKIKNDWLVNNAVVVFFGAVLLEQAAQSPPPPAETIFGFSISPLPPIAATATALFLLALASALTAASMIPPLRRLAFRLTTPIVPILEGLTWLAFTGGFFSSALGLLTVDWWTALIVIAGFLLWVFLLARFGFTIANTFLDRSNENSHPTSNQS